MTRAIAQAIVRWRAAVIAIWVVAAALGAPRAAKVHEVLSVDGATLLVNLSNDGWYRGRGGARQHLAQAVFRAVETGLPLIRATTTGISKTTPKANKRRVAKVRYSLIMIVG